MKNLISSTSFWTTEKLDPQLYRNSWDHRFRTHDPRAAITHLTPEEYRSLYLEVFKVTAPPQPKRILDYGCGTGLLIPVIEELWPEVIYDGVDISQEMVDYCLKTFFKGKVGDPCFWLVPEGFRYGSLSPYDFIVCHSVFTHITLEDGKELLKTLYGLLEDGGRASISVCVGNVFQISGNWGKVVYDDKYFNWMMERQGFEVTGCFQDAETRTGQRFYGVRKGEKRDE